MKTEWDYTTLADSYLKRPDYADSAIDELLRIATVRPGSAVCDVGAGVAHLTLMLLARGLNVTAVEPNDAMRAHGIFRTSAFPATQWFEGTGEATGQANESFELVTFGSSFNVTDRQQALTETARILKPKGWFACLWNHRDLNDKIQSSIEKIIGSHIPEYHYGTRRQDQTECIEAHKAFGHVSYIEGTVLHEQSIEDCITAWRSHGTLQRQAGDRFHTIIDQISHMLFSLERPFITIPYVTRLWAAQKQ